MPAKLADHLCVSFASSHVKSSPEVIISSVSFAPRKQQQLHALEIAALCKATKLAGGPLFIVAENSALLDERSAHLVMCASNGVCQRRSTPPVPRVD